MDPLDAAFEQQYAVEQEQDVSARQSIWVVSHRACERVVDGCSSKFEDHASLGLAFCIDAAIDIDGIKYFRFSRSEINESAVFLRICSDSMLSVSSKPKVKPKSCCNCLLQEDNEGLRRINASLQEKVLQSQLLSCYGARPQ